MLKITPIKLNEICDAVKKVKIYKSKAINSKDIFKGNLFKYFLTKNIYKITVNNYIETYMIKNTKDNILYIIANEDLHKYMAAILNYIQNCPDYYGYTIPILYKSLDEKPVFNSDYIKTCSDIKYMRVIPYSYSFYDNNIEIKQFNINHDEAVRVFLQNKIFENGKKERRELTIEEVTEEEFNSGFIEKLCFILYSLKNPCGYIQIIMLNKLYYLVNFGIIPEYRNNGLGKKLLLFIINKAKEYKIQNLYLTVDNNNSYALNLYYNVNFKELYNILTISILQH